MKTIHGSGHVAAVWMHAVGVVSVLSCLAASPAHAQSPRVESGRIAGVVYDSVARRPLAAATVQLLRIGSTNDMRTVTADATGRFQFDSVSTGEWSVGAWHPRLDSLGVAQLAKRTTVKRGKRREVTLAVPSAQSIVRRLCGDSVARDTLGVVMGTVRIADAAQSGTQATVRFTWYEWEIRGKQISQQTVRLDQTTSETGEYLACGVPVDSRFKAQAGTPTDSSGVIDVQPDNYHGVYRLDLFVGSPTRRLDTAIVTLKDSAETAVDTVVTPYLVGAGRVDGQARRPGGALAGAMVTLWGTGREVRTRDDGTFTLAGMPLGTHTLEMRAIGFEPARRTVDILPGAVATASFEMAKVTTLDTMRIKAWAMRDQGNFKEAEFLARKRRGGGVFLSPQDMARLNPVTMQQLFSQAGWVRTRWDIATGETVTMGVGQFRCTPLLILDGRPIDEESFFMTVRPGMILAAELYRRSGTPAEFSGPMTCGTIVVWTGDRPQYDPTQRR